MLIILSPSDQFYNYIENPIDYSQVIATQKCVFTTITKWRSCLIFILREEITEEKIFRTIRKKVMQKKRKERKKKSCKEVGKS